jgi:glycosyl transferase, family 25
MQIFYINLARRTDRRFYMEAQLERLGLAATRIEAVTTAELTEKELRSYCNPARGGAWNTPPGLASCKSHLFAMARLIASGQPHALVLEDDAVISSRLPRFLAAYDAASPATDLLHLETFGLSMRLARNTISRLEGVAIHRLWSEALGTAGYIISQRAALRAVQSHQLRVYPTDNALLDPYGCLSGLVLAQADPALIIQADHVPGHSVDVSRSDLESRNGRRQAEAPYRIRRLPGRLARALKRDLLDGPRKTWHGVVDGAKRRHVPFVD